MIERLTPLQFDQESPTGRTKPGFLLCEDGDGNEVEIVAKLSGGCDLRETSLAIELFAACLAGKLRLPVPQPFIVELSTEWLQATSSSAWSRGAASGSRCAFGSRRLPPAYRTWIAETPLIGEMTSVAAATLMFDAITDNPDRRDSNPNCLVRGDDIRLIDHELALSPVPLLGWRPPWTPGALHGLAQPGAHIFYAPLRRRTPDWQAIADTWHNLSDLDLIHCRNQIPLEWAAAFPAVDTAIEKIKNARANIAGCVVEIQRLLT